MFQSHKWTLFLMTLICFTIILGAANEIPSLGEVTDLRKTTVLTTNSMLTLSNISSEGRTIEILEETTKGFVSVETPKDPLDGESSLNIKEFYDIVRLYKKSPSNSSAKVQLNRSLLARLNKMGANTDFLEGQINIMKAAIRYQLGIKDRAKRTLTDLVKASPLLPIREEATKVYISYTYGDSQSINVFSKELKPYISAELVSYIELIQKSLDKSLTAEEATYLLHNLVLASIGTFQDKKMSAKALLNIHGLLAPEELTRAINILLYEDRIITAIPLMRLMVKNTEIDLDTLKLWGEKLGKEEKELVATVRIYKKRYLQYEEYTSFFDKQNAARYRGRTFHKRLYAYRGLEGSPYNVLMVKKTLDEYLKGTVDDEYLEKNAERSFRSFLAFKKYEELTNYTALMKEKMSPDFVSPYINFWQSHAALALGDTNTAIHSLGAIIGTAPDSYFGIMAQNLLKAIFKDIPYSARDYFRSLKDNSEKGLNEKLHYAHVLYYMGNMVAKKYAERMFVEEGLIQNLGGDKLPSNKHSLMNSYLTLGLDMDVRQLAYHNGVKSIYGQDNVLMNYYTKNDRTSDILGIIGDRQNTIIAKPRFVLGKDILGMYYPRPHEDVVLDTIQKSERDMDMAIIYSVMRAESFYKEKAKSHAGARGLMQIMPVTGEWLADKYLPEVTEYSLYTPEINIYLGSVYLYDNIDKIGMLPALAAYNSGPTYMRKLANKYKPRNAIELVEIHPKSETRNYVRKVVEFYQRYTYVYNDDQKHALIS